MNLREILAASAIDKSELIILLCHVLNISKEQLFTNDLEIDECDYSKINDLVKRRLAKEPVAYIVGKKQFYGYDFIVNNNVLVPRPETELIVDYVLDSTLHNDEFNLIDIGTGSGSIAVSIAKNRKKANIFASDINLLSLNLAKKNIELNGVKNIHLFKQDLLQSVSTFYKFDFIVCNPPYISNEEYKNLEKDLYYEPKISLIAPLNGYFYLKQLIYEGKKYLKSDGKLILEHGHNQKEECVNFFQKKGYNNIECLLDLNNINRVTLGQNS